MKKAAFIAGAALLLLFGSAGAPLEAPPEALSGCAPCCADCPDGGGCPSVRAPMAALTFDDGPNGENTLLILGMLEEYGAKATFFLSGCNLTEDQFPTARRIAEAGCEIGNHTYSHRELTKLTPEELRWEIEATDELIFQAAGCRPALLRPPYGAFDERVLAAGRPVVTWSIDTGDWKYQNPEYSLQVVKDNAFDGCIILMHDMFPATADTCALVIPWLLDEGYRLVTVSEMFSAKNEALCAGSSYRFAG